MIEFILFSIYYIPFKFYAILIPFVFLGYTFFQYHKLNFKDLKPLFILIIYLLFTFLIRSWHLSVFLTGIYFYLFPLFFIALFYYPDDQRIEKIINFNSFLVISQIPFILYQFIQNIYNKGFNFGSISHDWAVGSIKLFSKAGSHEPGVIMMMNFLFYINLYFLYKKKKFLYISIFAFIFWVLTSTTHSYMAFILGVLIFILSQNIIYLFKRIILYGLVVGILHFVLIYTQYDAYMSFFNVLNSKNIEKYGKAQLFNNTYSMIKDNIDVAIIGTGLGRYNSRTAAITTSDYISPTVKRLYGIENSEFISKYLLNITQAIDSRFMKREYKTVYNYESVINKPYSSIVSILIEFGLIGSFIFYFFVFKIYLNLYKNNKYLPKMYSIIRYEASLFILICLCFLDGWLEYPKFMGIYIILTCLFIRVGNSFKKKIKQKQEIVTI